MKKIAIIVLNYKHAKLSFKLIKQFKKINTKDLFCHIFLVDNCSPDNSYQQFCKKLSDNPQVTIYQTNKNGGYSAGVNFGLKKAIYKRFDYALIINNDVKLKKDFLINLYKPFLKNPNLAITGPKIYFAKGHEYHKNKYKKSHLGKIIWSAGGTIDWQNIYGFNKGIDQVDRGQFNKIDTNIDFISGCCLLMDLKKIKKIGLFDERYFMYLEDADLCHRIKQAGFTIAYIPSSIIWHYNAGSSQAGGDLQQYFLSRNRLLFANKFAKFKTKFALFRQSMITIVFGKYKWQKKGVVDYFLHKFYKGSWQ